MSSPFSSLSVKKERIITNKNHYSSKKNKVMKLMIYKRIQHPDRIIYFLKAREGQQILREKLKTDDRNLTNFR